MNYFQDRILKNAFEKACYRYSEDTIERSVKIIRNYLYLYYPKEYIQYSYDEIREELIKYQKDKEIKWRINDYIINGEIIYTDPRAIMKELNIIEERYLHDIVLALKTIEHQTLNL